MHIRRRVIHHPLHHAQHNGPTTHDTIFHVFRVAYRWIDADGVVLPTVGASDGGTFKQAQALALGRALTASYQRLRLGISSLTRFFATLAKSHAVNAVMSATV